MAIVVLATSRSPARSATRGASPGSNGRRISRSVSSVGRFFVDGVTWPNLSFMNDPRQQAAQSRRQTLGSLGEIQRGFSITSFEFHAPRVRMVGDFQYDRPNAQ